MYKEQRLLNKKTIVTGGARGIGAGIVKRLYAEGAKIIISDFREELALQEYNFAKKIADPVKICQEWDKLFIHYLKEISTQKKISSNEIKLRQTNFFFANKLYWNKIKRKIDGEL